MFYIDTAASMGQLRIPCRGAIQSINLALISSRRQEVDCLSKACTRRTTHCIQTEQNSPRSAKRNKNKQNIPFSPTHHSVCFIYRILVCRIMTLALPIISWDVTCSVMRREADKQTTQTAGQTVRLCGKWREKDNVTVNNELGELFPSLILPVFRGVTRPLGCGLIDF